MKSFGRVSRIIRKPISLNCGQLCRISTTKDLERAPYVPYTHGAHRSNARELISRVPPIEVNGHVAICDGGGGVLGHPLEYIQLDTVSTEPQVCKYCGLRFIKSHHH